MVLGDYPEDMIICIFTYYILTPSPLWVTGTYADWPTPAVGPWAPPSPQKSQFALFYPFLLSTHELKFLL